MNAKYGKISIGCFIAIWPVAALLLLLSNPQSCPAGQPGMFVAPWAFLCVLIGTIFGIVGAVKKEQPPTKYIIGISLNVGLVVLYGILGILAAIFNW